MSTGITGATLSTIQQAAASADDATSKTRVDRVVRKRVLNVPVVLAASLTLDLMKVEQEQGITVTGVEIASSATLASGATDFWQFQLVYNDNAAGANTSVTSTFTGSVTALTSHVGTAMTLSTTGGVTIASTKALQFIATKNASAASHTLNLRVSFTED